MKTIKLSLTSGREAELKPEHILCNDITLPWEVHPCKMSLWVIGNEYGALGAVWASQEQDALDQLIDSGLGDALLIDEADVKEDSTRLGNAGEPANLTYAWIQKIDLKKADCALLCMFAEARGSNANTLADI